MISLADIGLALANKGYLPYKVIDPTNSYLCVKQGPAGRLVADATYSIFADIGDRKDLALIQAFNQANDIAPPAIIMPVRRIVEHTFSDEHGDCTVLEPGDLVVLNGFRSEGRNRIVINLQGGQIWLKREDFFEAIQSIPELPGLAAAIFGTDGVARKPFNAVRSRKDLIAWLAASRSRVDWAGNSTHLHANHYAGQKRYWLELRYDVLGCGRLDDFSIVVSGPRSKLAITKGQIRPLVFCELWNRVAPVKQQIPSIPELLGQK